MRKRHAERPAEPAAAEPAFFTIAELAKRWRVNRHTITRAIRSGRLQAFKAGDLQYRIREAEVIRYEQQALGVVAS